MTELSEFLTSEEEFFLKEKYINNKSIGINEIISNIDDLNSINGLVVLSARQGNLCNPMSYIVLKIKEELVYPFTNVIYEIMELFNHVSVDWDYIIDIPINGKKVQHSGIAVIGNMNHLYMDMLFKRLK